MLSTAQTVIPGSRICMSTKTMGFIRMATHGFLYPFLSRWYSTPRQRSSSPPDCANTDNKTIRSFSTGNDEKLS